MNADKIGKLIYQLRKERNMTQKQLAERLLVSDKTVSKWERGGGIPDVGLLRALSNTFGIDMERLLAGDLEEQGKNGGNMKRIQFFVCEHCGSIYWGTGKGEFTCCGRKAGALQVQNTLEHHEAVHHDGMFEKTDNEWYITFSHPMEKEHYLTFVAWVSWDRATVIRLYPEQEAAVRIPRGRGDLYVHCNKEGLFQMKAPQ